MVVIFRRNGWNARASLIELNAWEALIWGPQIESDRTSLDDFVVLLFMMLSGQHSPAKFSTVTKRALSNGERRNSSAPPSLTFKLPHSSSVSFEETALKRANKSQIIVKQIKAPKIYKSAASKKWIKVRPLARWRSSSFLVKLLHHRITLDIVFFFFGIFSLDIVFLQSSHSHLLSLRRVSVCGDLSAC